VKFVWAISVFIVSLSVFASIAYESKWVPKKPYVVKAEDKNILIIAKIWAANNYKTDIEKHDFEYSVQKLNVGFRLMVAPIYRASNGKYTYTVDGEMCLDFDRKRTLVQVYQCTFPPIEALKRH
jgi:hypothetical protein